MQHVLVDDLAGNRAEADATPFQKHIQDNKNSEYGIVQVSIPGAATISIRGRLSRNMPWTEITSFTSSGATRVSLMSHMLATVSGHSAGAVRVELREI